MFLCQQEQKQDLRLLLEFFGQNFPKCCQFCLKFWPVMTCKMIRLKEEFFLFTLSFTLWFTPQDFAKWKALLSYVSVVSFISIVNVVVKLKFSKFFGLIQIHEMVPFLGVGWGREVWARTPPTIVQSCWNFEQEYSPIRQTQFCKIL